MWWFQILSPGTYEHCDQAQTLRVWSHDPEQMAAPSGETHRVLTWFSCSNKRWLGTPWGHPRRWWYNRCIQQDTLREKSTLEAAQRRQRQHTVSSDPEAKASPPRLVSDTVGVRFLCLKGLHTLSREHVPPNGFLVTSLKEGVPCLWGGQVQTEYVGPMPMKSTAAAACSPHSAGTRAVAAGCQDLHIRVGEAASWQIVGVHSNRLLFGSLVSIFVKRQ